MQTPNWKKNENVKKEFIGTKFACSITKLSSQFEEIMMHVYCFTIEK